MNTKKEPGLQKPDWIPWQGWDVCQTVQEQGGFSNERYKQVSEKLFFSKRLEIVWKELAKSSPSLEGWRYIVRSMINSIDCAPLKGKRSTRDRPDEKIEILDQQKRVDKLLGKAVDQAYKLLETLEQLEKNGGKLPAEVYSGLALVETAINQPNTMAKASCGKPFDVFKRELSSYARSHFPKSNEIIYALAGAMESYPDTKQCFYDDKWLSSSQSTWKDYVRVVLECFKECEIIHGTKPQLSDAAWTNLLQEFVDKAITRQTVAKGLKEL